MFQVDETEGAGQRNTEEGGAYQKWQGEQLGGKDRILRIFSLREDLSTPLPVLNWQKMGSHQSYFISRVTCSK